MAACSPLPLMSRPAISRAGSSAPLSALAAPGARVTQVYMLTLGSLMKFCPLRLLGGSEPVVAIFRHSMMVCKGTR